jgi:transposase
MPHPPDPEEKPPSPTSSTSSPNKASRFDVPQDTCEEIVQLHAHYGTRAIACRVGFSRKIVRRVLEEAGLSSEPAQKDKLARFGEQIRIRVEKDLTTSRILREIRELGYKGGRTILAERARALRSELELTPKKTIKRRFETRPGLEMQIDWSPYVVPIAGRPTTVRAFGALLCASRKLWAHCYRDERQPTLMEALVSAFEYFDGCTLRVVMDNMATAVLGRYGSDGKPIWHPTFLDVMRHYGSEPFACQVRDPDRKGKKEKSFRLLWDDCLKGCEFASLDELNQRLAAWLDHSPEVANQRKHGTTGLIPNEVWISEREFLIPLPSKRFPVAEQTILIVDQDSTLAIRGRRYNVPTSFGNRSVAVRLYAEHFELLDRFGRVAFSRRYVADSDPRKLIIDEALYAPLPRGRSRASGRRLDDAFLARFPSLGTLASGLRLRMKALAPIHFRALLRLAERYDEAAFLAAATRAQEFHRFDARAVERILETQGAIPVDDPAPLGGLGAALLSDVDSGSLDAYGQLDTNPTSVPTDDPEQENPNGS